MWKLQKPWVTTSQLRCYVPTSQIYALCVSMCILCNSFSCIPLSDAVVCWFNLVHTCKNFDVTCNQKNEWQPNGESSSNTHLLGIPDVHARILGKILHHASAAGNQTFLGNHNHLPEGLPDTGQKWAGVGHSGCPQWSGDVEFPPVWKLETTDSSDSLVLLVYGVSVGIQVAKFIQDSISIIFPAPCQTIVKQSSNYLTLPEMTYWDQGESIDVIIFRRVKQICSTVRTHDETVACFTIWFNGYQYVTMPIAMNIK